MSLFHHGFIRKWLFESAKKLNGNLLEYAKKLNGNPLEYAKKLIGNFVLIPPSVVILGGPLAVDLYDDRCIYDKLISGPEELLEGSNYFTRFKLEEDITQIISGKKSYYLVTGEHGIGKTSLMSHIAKEGVIYVSCPVDPLKFGQAFADAIGYTSIYNPSLYRRVYTALSILPSSGNVEGPMPEFWASQNKFFEALKKYKKRTGRIPILIIDNINMFCNTEEARRFLLHLQRIAKECADKGTLTIVFVTSEGQGEYALSTDSSKSRMTTIEMPDLMDTEIFPFLEFMLERDEIIKKQEAELNDIINTLTGGRILYLTKVVAALNEGISLSDTKMRIISDVTKDFKKAGMLTPPDFRYKSFWQIAEKLLIVESISDIEAHKLLGTLYEEMRKSNVFAFHESTDSITFQSRAHKCVAIQLKQKRNGFILPLVTSIGSLLTPYIKFPSFP